MPGQGPPSEFGGKVQTNGVQPPPHVPTASEALSLLYRTGTDDGTMPPDDGSAWLGLLPAGEQRALREAEGAFDHGQFWEGINGGI